MLKEILLLIAGLALVLAGADALVDGASGIARKAGISEFVLDITAMICPVAVTATNMRRDIPIT